MDEARARQDLAARLHNLGERIAERRNHIRPPSAASAAGGWDEIVAAHKRLAARLDEERDHDASALERLRADIEALHLSFDSWIASVDRAYEAQTEPVARS